MRKSKKNFEKQIEVEKSRKCAHGHTYVWCTASTAAKVIKQQDSEASAGTFAIPKLVVNFKIWICNLQSPGPDTGTETGATQRASQPTNQADSKAARHRQSECKNRSREAHRHSHAHRQSEALLAPVRDGSQWRPQRNSPEKSSAVARQHLLGRNQALLETLDFT